MGHVQDRWYRPKRDGETGKIALNAAGKPVLEKTELHGVGLRYKVRYIDPDGNEKSKSFPDKQKRRADDFLIEVESDKREGKYIDPQAARKLFREQAESWVRAQSPDPATREALRSRLESRIYPTFGDLKIGRIKPSDVREWLAELDDAGYSENYKSVLFDVVVGVLDSAVDDKLIRDNPCKAKSVRRPVPASPKITVRPEERVHDIRRGLVGRSSIVVPVGSGLGLRQGEILGFSPDDIDRDELVAHVQRQVKRVCGVLMFAPPKRGKTRVVPLSPAILAEIDDHLASFPAVNVTLPWAKADGDLCTVPLLVTRDDGLPYSGDLFHKTAWSGAFRKAGVDYRKRADGMHALRHFYASTLLSRGVSITELSEYLGHADPGFTLRTYTHLVPTSYERARLAVDEVFGRPEPDDGLQAA